MPVVGTAPVKPCPQCQFRNNTHSTFCQNCGQVLAKPQAVPSTQPVAKPIAQSPVNQSSTQPVAKPIARPPVNQLLGAPATRPLTPPAPYQTSPIASSTQSTHQKLLFQLQMFAYGLIGLGSIMLICFIFGPFVQNNIAGGFGDTLGASMGSSFSALHMLGMLLGVLFDDRFSNGSIFIVLGIIAILLLPIFAVIVIMTGSKMYKGFTLNHPPQPIKLLQIGSGIMLGFWGFLYSAFNFRLSVNGNLAKIFGIEGDIGLGWGFTFSVISILVLFISCIWYKNTVLKLSVTP
ncbi:hypothetical protein [Herpetosiphon sp. NSE202]|uniref:hypothetical protein n=1 Tax=Herpetosiphon sp. NSE202 TaxID=3351349 RepID=UPI00362CDB33